MVHGNTLRRQQSAVEKTLHDQTDLLPRRKLFVVFATLSITLLIAFIDQNGISVSLPSIGRDLDAQNTISWAGTSSLIANTTFQMLYGRLSDIFGRKRVFLAAVGCLALADLLCGLARNGPMFYVFRAVAGIGGGGITNLAMIIVSDVVSLEQRGFYQGIIGATLGMGNVVGPFLSAAFTMRSTWRGFFYLLTPLGVLGGCVAAYLLPSKPPTGSFREGARNIDFVGILCASATVVLVLIPISGGGSYFRWDSPMVIAMLAVGGCLAVVFVAMELWVARLPMMPMPLFKSPIVSILMLQSFLLGASYQTLLYYLPVFLQNPRQYSVMASAGISAALVVFQSCCSILSGQYLSRRKRYGEVIWFGFSIWTLGAGLFLLNNRHTSLAAILIPLMLTGAGIGATLQPTLVALQANTTKARRAVVISVRNFWRATGGAFGLAAAAAVLQAGLRTHLPADYKYLADNAFYLPSDFPSVADREAVLDAYMAANHTVFVMLVPLDAACLLCCFFIKDRGLEPTDVREARQKAEAEAAAAEAAGGAIVVDTEMETGAEADEAAIDAFEGEQDKDEFSDAVRPVDEEMGAIPHAAEHVATEKPEPAERPNTPIVEARP